MRPLLAAIVLAPLALLCTCGPAPANPEHAESPTAEQLIERAISTHGMDGWDTLARLTFTFRDRSYGVDKRGGTFRYTREFMDSTGSAIRDVLTNEGLERLRDGQPDPLTTKDSLAYVGSVNSVRYFFMLPYGLRDPAVNAELLDSVAIDGKVYDRLEVTFDREGGGTDFDDVYHYFFDRSSGELDYLAYNFAAEEGGVRLRKAINKRRVGGVLVQDYINYGVDGRQRAIDAALERYLAGELPELSRIENTEVRIESGG